MNRVWGMWRAALMVACLSPLVACVDLGFGGQTAGNVGAVWSTQGSTGGYSGAPTLQWTAAGSGTPGTFGVQGYDERTYSSPTNYYPGITAANDPPWSFRNDPLMTSTGSQLIITPERSVWSSFNTARAAAANPGGGLGGGGIGGIGGGGTVGTYTLIRIGTSLSKCARANSRYASNLNLGAIPATNRSGDSVNAGGGPSNVPRGRLAKCLLTTVTNPVEATWVGAPTTTYTDASNYFVGLNPATNQAYTICGVGHWYNNNYKYWTVIFGYNGPTN